MDAGLPRCGSLTLRESLNVALCRTRHSRRRAYQPHKIQYIGQMIQLYLGSILQPDVVNVLYFSQAAVEIVRKLRA
jgi:hypothetical protein